MTLREYRLSLAWSLSELARRSGLTYNTVSRIEKGEPAYEHSVAAIAKALSEGLGRTVSIHDIQGVVIREF